MRLICGMLLSAAFVSAESAYLNSVGVDELIEMIHELNVTDAAPASDVCWKDSYGRGVGRPIHTCPDDKEKDAGLCYPFCDEGYNGVGPVCWDACKPEYNDIGALCTIPLKITSADNSACPWYDKCGLVGAKGCSNCDAVGPEFKNDGCTCRRSAQTYAKHSYGRGVGKPLGCANDEQYDAGLCYDFCGDEFKGVGPVCWMQCPADTPYNGGAMCCKDEATCKESVYEMTWATLTAIAKAIEATLDPNEITRLEAIKAAIELALAFTMPVCYE